MNGNFPPAQWNCYQNYDPRTTNHVEGWHRMLNKKVKVAHPNTFVLIKALQSEKETTRNRIKELDIDCTPWKKFIVI